MAIHIAASTVGLGFVLSATIFQGVVAGLTGAFSLVEAKEESVIASEYVVELHTQDLVVPVIATDLLPEVTPLRVEAEVVSPPVPEAVSASSSSVPVSAPLDVPIDDGPAPKEIHIDLGVQKMFLMEYGIVTKTYPISSGAWETPTPTGKYQVHKKEELRISQQGVPYRMPYYLSFTKTSSHGMHALPYLGASPNASYYWQEALDHIGTPVSHGCVRLLPEDAVELYGWADVGTPITISRQTEFRETVVLVE